MDLTKERTLVLEADARTAEAARRRDVEAVLSHWSDDAVVMGPGMGPIEGKAALRELVETSMSDPDFSITWTTESAVLSDDASMACLRGQQEVNVEDLEKGRQRLVGPFVSIWRRDAEQGEWRCVLDITTNVPSEG